MNNQNNESNVIRDLELGMDENVENTVKSVEQDKPYDGIENPNIVRHLKNLERLKYIYYDKEIALYYNVYCSQITKDTTLSESEKNFLLETFRERNNARVNSGNKRIELMKALDMFALYKRNNKVIDMQFITDVKLRNIIESRELAVDYIRTLTNKYITEIYFNYWTYAGALYAKEGIPAITVYPNVKDAMEGLVRMGLIDKVIFLKLCKLAELKLNKLDEHYGLKGE